MPKRSRKNRLPDANVAAFNIVQAIAGEPQAVPIPPTTTTGGKNPAAVMLGRLGGLKGGVARAKKLSKKTLSELARKAALARWGTKHGKTKKEKGSGSKTAPRV